VIAHIKIREDIVVAVGKNCKLFVGNITYKTDEKFLAELFGKHGTVTECKIAGKNTTCL
jgi:RNA recognition motif-containing protein